MNSATENIQLISVPLTARDRQAAKDFAEQFDPEKQSQAYQLRLAVMITHRYFTMLGIPSDLEQKRPVKQDTADLYVNEIEDWIQCRAVKSNDEYCYIPAAVQQNRAGFIIVELSDDERSGLIRGFVPEVSTEQLRLDSLQPLDGFFERIALGVVVSDPMVAPPVAAATAVAAEQTKGSLVEVLSEWISGIFSPAWLPPRELPPSLQMVVGDLPVEQKVDDAIAKAVVDLCKTDGSLNLLPPDQSKSAVIEALTSLVAQTENDWTRWKAAELMHKVAPDHPAAATIKAKDLGLYLGGQKVALLIGIAIKPNGEAMVLARVYPMGDRGVLPHRLKLSGLTPTSQIIFEVEARQNDDYIQSLFTADLGDEFMLHVSSADASITEIFSV